MRSRAGGGDSQNAPTKPAALWLAGFRSPIPLRSASFGGHASGEQKVIILLHHAGVKTHLLPIHI